MTIKQRIFTLENGLQCAFQAQRSSVAHVVVAVRAGARDELDHQQGLAHFLEHNLFKGTSKRKAYHILSRLDDVGGELNAYTTKEETIIHASFLKTGNRRIRSILAKPRAPPVVAPYLSLPCLNNNWVQKVFLWALV